MDGSQNWHPPPQLLNGFLQMIGMNESNIHPIPHPDKIIPPILYAPTPSFCALTISAAALLTLLDIS